jgi:SAM-dependent methyltransferase
VSVLEEPAGFLTEIAFDPVADTYDETFTNSLIGRAQREVVWEELDRVFRRGDRVLELNCGTGVDALHLANRGVVVLGCDVAPRMIDTANRRLSLMSARAEASAAGPAKITAPVAFRILANERIRELRESAFAEFRPFDGAFSNFAGLNCVEDLIGFARDLARLVKPRGLIVLCLFGRFCVWEILWYLAHGQTGKAFRRLRGGGCSASPSGKGTPVHVRYYSVRKLASIFGPEFRLKRWRGVGIAVPPSYVEPLARRFPAALDYLVSFDRRLGALPLVGAVADHVLLTLERVDDHNSPGS